MLVLWRLLYWDCGCNAECCTSVFCRKNGKYLGVAFRNIVNMPLYPTIGLHRYALPFNLPMP